MDCEQFVDNDVAYLAWMDEHPEGYVVNTTKRSNPKYLVLHRAGCPHIRSHSNPNAFTGMGYMKVCGSDQGDLLLWVKQRGAPGFTKRCSTCDP